MSDELDQRIRLVVLGGAGVGKTAIIKRFLFNTFDEKYRSTVEDLYYREYDIGNVTIKVDILDTAGDLQFPAMRRLSIATAGAFLLVFSVTSAPSFTILQQCCSEIREQRSDFAEIPIMVVGNKADVDKRLREVPLEDVTEYVYCDLPRVRAKVLECSAKSALNVQDIFRSFLQLGKIPTPGSANSSDDASGSGGGAGLRRRSSAYGSLRPSETRLSPSPRRDSLGVVGAASEGSESGGKLKPRSRSLIRRSSRKSKLRDSTSPARTGRDDCNVS